MAVPDTPEPIDSIPTNVAEIRGIRIPAGAGYDRHEEWLWVEENEDNTISTFRLELHVTVEPKEDEDDPA